MKKLFYLLAVGLCFIACDKPDVPEPEDPKAFIDLGLPSGTKWRATNEVNPANGSMFMTYAVAMNLYGDQMPTKEQWEELRDNCTWQVLKKGLLAVGKNGNSIYFWGAGFKSPYDDRDLVFDVDKCCSFWASTTFGDEEAYQAGFGFNDVYKLYVATSDRIYERCVRLVQK